MPSSNKFSKSIIPLLSEEVICHFQFFLNSNLYLLDYTNAVTLNSSNFPYTVPKNGILVVEVTPNSGNACVLRISNGNINLTTGSYETTVTNEFLVNKGEILSITVSINLKSYGIKLIPFK